MIAAIMVAAGAIQPAIVSIANLSAQRPLIILVRLLAAAVERRHLERRGVRVFLIGLPPKWPAATLYRQPRSGVEICSVWLPVKIAAFNINNGLLTGPATGDRRKPDLQAVACRQDPGGVRR